MNFYVVLKMTIWWLWCVMKSKIPNAYSIQTAEILSWLLALWNGNKIYNKIEWLFFLFAKEICKILTVKKWIATCLCMQVLEWKADVFYRAYNIFSNEVFKLATLKMCGLFWKDKPPLRISFKCSESVSNAQKSYSCDL